MFNLHKKLKLIQILHVSAIYTLALEIGMEAGRICGRSREVRFVFERACLQAAPDRASIKTADDPTTTRDCERSHRPSLTSFARLLGRSLATRVSDTALLYVRKRDKRIERDLVRRSGPMSTLNGCPGTLSSVANAKQLPKT